MNDLEAKRDNNLLFYHIMLSFVHETLNKRIVAYKTEKKLHLITAS